MSVQWLEICRQVSNGDLITRKTTHNMRKIMEERLSIMIVIVSSLYSKTTKPSSSSRQNAGITKPFNITSHEDFKTFYLNVNIPTQCQNRSYQLTDDEFLSNQSLREWGIRLWPRRRHLSSNQILWIFRNDFKSETTAGFTSHSNLKYQNCTKIPTTLKLNTNNT